MSTAPIENDVALLPVLSSSSAPSTALSMNAPAPASASASISPSEKTSSPSNVSYLATEVNISHVDIPLFACCLVSGLCDSSAYNAWTCFVSMQTGNTIFLALGASGQPLSKPFGWLKSLVSIGSFLCGCFIFSLTRYFKPKSRGTLAVSFLLQCLFILAAASLVHSSVVPDNKIASKEFEPIELLPLCLLAIQAGGQIMSSRILGINEVPTTVLTSVYCDLISDPHLLTVSNVKRNRRLIAIISLLGGGIAGGWLSKSEAGMSSALWIAAAIKFAIAISWLFWKEAPLAKK